MLMPLFYRLQAYVMTAERLHGDDTTVPVLARDNTDIARLWTYVASAAEAGARHGVARATDYLLNAGGRSPGSWTMAEFASQTTPPDAR